MKEDIVVAYFQLHKILIFVKRPHPVEVSKVPRSLTLVTGDLAGVESKMRLVF
jgi:hypothetical protein